MSKILISYARDARLPAYREALEACGVPAEEIVPLSPSRFRGDAEAALGEIDGLLLSGGSDVDPAHYGEPPAPGVEFDGLVPERDAMELALVAVARHRRLPVLAVCRGLQLVNVALGGSLWQDLESQAGKPGHNFATDAGHAPDRPAHTVLADGDGAHPARAWLARHAAMRVNSRHHQAVRRPSDELEIVGRAPDGVVEAMAGRDPAWWVWGVQWHPENLIGAAPHRELFETFLAACAARRARESAA